MRRWRNVGDAGSHALQLERLKSKAKGGLDKARQGIESGIDAATKKAGEEVKKGKDKIHP